MINFGGILGDDDDSIFFIKKGTPIPIPSIIEVTPSNINQGETETITIFGENFTDVASIVFSGTGLTVSDIVLLDSSTITCDVTADVDATLGERDITINFTNSQTAFLDNAVEVKFTGLLDLYPNASAAYSLRLLRRAYTGAAIRVRRSNDNAEQDISFVSDGVKFVLDTASLLLFVGANDGFVTTWYDQSGNGYDATQPTGANQPQIVSSGTVITTNAKPSTQWISEQEMRLFNNFGLLNQPTTFFTVSRLSAASGIPPSVIFDSYENLQHILFNTGFSESPNNTFGVAAGVFETIQAGDTNVNFFNGVFNSSNSEVYNHNTSLFSGNLGSNGIYGISIGHVRGNPNPLVLTYGMSGEIQEIILYNSNQGGSRANISNNIHSFYN